MIARLGKAVGMAAALALAACSSTDKPAEPKSPLDTPESAVSKGMTNIEQGNYLVAEKAFERALELEPGHVPAYAGQTILNIETGRYDEAREALANARDADPTDAQRRRLAKLEIRLLRTAKREDWYDAATDVFQDAEAEIPAAGEDPGLLRAIARAAMDAYRNDRSDERLSDARSYARRLTRTDSSLSADGQQMLARLDQIERAQIQASPAVRDIATAEALTRRQLAVLLDKTLGLTRYLDGVAFNRADDGETTAEGESDYAHLDEAEAIRNASRAPLRGLSIKDGRFHPKKTVSREAFALVLLDLLRTRTGDSDLGDKQFGSSSPFDDVGSNRVSFSAIMTAVSRNLMEAKGNGTFAPTEPVRGSAAIEALRQLRRVGPGSA
jgi:tetratricopeptide (TPR) repeat protein